MGFNISFRTALSEIVSQENEEFVNNASNKDFLVNRNAINQNIINGTLVFNSASRISSELNNNSFPGSTSFERDVNARGFASQQNTVSEDVLDEIRNSRTTTGQEFSDVDTRYYQNFSEEAFTISSSSLDEIINSISGSVETSDMSNSFPSILSHEIFKYNLTETSFLLSSRISNDNKLSPNDVFLLKNNYIKNIQEMNAQRFFISCDFLDIQKEFHYENLKESFKEIKEIREDIDQIILKKDEIKKQINFGNIVYDFFLDNSNSNIFGFVYDNIFTDEDYLNTSRSFSDQSFMNFNNASQNNTDIQLSGQLESIYNKVLRLSIKRSDIYGSKILNSDKTIGQLLVNASLMQNTLYNNILGYDIGLDENATEIRSFLSFKEVEKFTFVYLNYKSRAFNGNNNSNITNIDYLNKDKIEISNNFFRLNKHKVSNYFSSNFMNNDLEVMLNFFAYSQNKNYLQHIL